MLAAEVRLNFVWDLVDSLSNNIQGGYMYIVSDKGTVIAHPDYKLAINNEDFSSFGFIQDLLADNEGTDVYTDPFNENEPMFCSYTPVRELHWGIVVAQSESEAFEASRNMLYKLIYIIIGSIIFAGFLGIITYWRARLMSSISEVKLVPMTRRNG